MHKTIIQRPEIKLVGIKTRTNNAQILAADHSNNPIAAIVMKYFHGALSEKISQRRNPGTTFCAYTEYENDFMGDYTYFIGEEVTNLDHVPEGFETVLIPAQTYAKLTSEPGPMPDVCTNLWQQIWKMTDHDLGGQRTYITDFEIYDQRASDHQHVVLDICIGIKK